MKKTLDNILHLRYHEKSCTICRYIRHHATVATTSECLLLGRTMGIAPANQSYLLLGWDRQRLCDGWKQRPATWDIYCNGTDSNPYFHDKYYKRETLMRLRKKYEKNTRR